MAQKLMERPTAEGGSTPARAKLREALQQVADAAEAAQQAEAEHDAAWAAYRQQQRAVEDIEAAQDALVLEANRLPAAARWNYQTRVDEFEPPLHQARLPLMDLSQAEASAKAKADNLKMRLSFANDQVTRSATDVVRAEAPAEAAAMAARLAEALQTIAQVGPDLAYLVGYDLVSKDVLANMPGAPRLLDMCTTGWPEFAAAYRSSPWRGAVAALASDPDAALPVVAPT